MQAYLSRDYLLQIPHCTKNYTFRVGNHKFIFYPWKDQKDKSDKLNVEIDYIADDPELDPVTLQFSKVFDAFRAAQIVDNEMNQDSRKGPIKQVKPFSISIVSSRRSVSF